MMGGGRGAFSINVSSVFPFTSISGDLLCRPLFSTSSPSRLPLAASIATIE
ncbi:hypothetical protein RHGRI_037078 [Rhododendron griersonianum]|uniref:Uncharacterized protein n=1 Tax=Rhododendron griersonianum TaxID=479676 RepID=A0AAV6HQY5_9ERIC|nr:hypothetical protein RHGRI_037078 [Rhododendron griersonianum]